MEGRPSESKVMLAVLLLVLIQLRFSLQMCPGPDDMYVRRGEDGFKKCKKIYNCGPGNEIRPCNVECGEERCVACPTGKVQANWIHSETTGSLSCYDDNPECASPDVSPSSNTGRSSFSCPKMEYCKCNRQDCFYGTNPCICKRQFDICKVNHTMDPVTGECIPCGPGEYTSVEGCRQCFKMNPHSNIYLTNQVTTQITTTPLPVTKAPIIESSSIETTIAVTTKKPEGVGGSNPDVSTTNDDTSGSSVTIIAVVVVFIILAVVAVVVVFFVWKRKKRNNGGPHINEDRTQYHLENGDAGINNVDNVDIRVQDEEINRLVPETPDANSIGCNSRTPLIIPPIRPSSEPEKTPVVETEPPELHPFLRQASTFSGGSCEVEVNSSSNNIYNLNGQLDSLPDSVQTPSSGVSIVTNDPRVSNVPESPPVQETEINVRQGYSYPTRSFDSEDVAHQVHVCRHEPSENEEETQSKNKELQLDEDPSSREPDNSLKKT